MGDFSASLSPLLPIRIITHNIRYAASPSERFKHEAPWSNRATPLSQQLHFLTQKHFAPNHSVICLQEVLTQQFRDISSALGDEWECMGVGRDDGKDGGERCMICWRKEAWECLYYDTLWLNETGEVGRKGWDAVCVRVVTCVVLQDKLKEGEVKKGKKVLVMTTHLDNQGVVARREGARILLGALRRLSGQWDVDAGALAGDLNSDITGDAYRILNEASGVRDARDCVDAEYYGDVNTYTGFDGRGDGEQVKKIDFVFVGTGERLERARVVVKGYAVLPNVFEEGVRMSDHRAVVIDIVA